MSSRADKLTADQFQNPAHGGENGFQGRLADHLKTSVAKRIEGMPETLENLLGNPSAKNGDRSVQSARPGWKLGSKSNAGSRE